MSYVPEKTIYLCLAHMSEEGLEQKYVKEAFDTNWVVPLGPNVNGFEADLKEFVGGQSDYVVWRSMLFGLIDWDSGGLKICLRCERGGRGFGA